MREISLGPGSEHDAMEERVVSAWLARRRRRRWQNGLLIIGLCAMSVIAGDWRRQHVTRAAGRSSLERHRSLPAYALFLLGQAPEAVSRAPGELEEEYRAWTASLARAGRVSFAREVRGAPTVIEGQQVHTRAPSDAVTGMFIVFAADSADAHAMALTLPHVRDGGRVQVQRVDAPR